MTDIKPDIYESFLRSIHGLDIVNLIFIWSGSGGEYAGEIF